MRRLTFSDTSDDGIRRNWSQNQRILASDSGRPPPAARTRPPHPKDIAMPRKSTLDPKVKALLDNLNLDDGDDALLAEPAEDATEHLRILYERLANGRERALRPGMLAIWKPGLKNRRFPRYGEPVVVVALLDTPIINPGDESGSPYFREPLDLLLGLVRGDDREFLVYHADRRRFQPYEAGGTRNRP